MYMLKVSDNNNTSVYEFDTKADAMKVRTRIIRAYGYKRSAGWIRENDKDVVYFRHPVYSTVVLDVYNYYI